MNAKIKILTLGMVIAISMSAAMKAKATEGGNSGGGGSGCMAAIMRNVTDVSNWLRNNGHLLNPVITSKNFNDAAKTEIFKFTNANLNYMGNPVDAYYDGNSILIRCDRLIKNDPSTQRALIAHELFRHLKVEGDEYEVSRQIPILFAQDLRNPSKESSIHIINGTKVTFTKDVVIENGVFLKTKIKTPCETVIGQSTGFRYGPQGTERDYGTFDIAGLKNRNVFLVLDSPRTGYKAVIRAGSEYNLSREVFIAPKDLELYRGRPELVIKTNRIVLTRVGDPSKRIILAAYDAQKYMSDINHFLNNIKDNPWANFCEVTPKHQIEALQDIGANVELADDLIEY